MRSATLEAARDETVRLYEALVRIAESGAVICIDRNVVRISKRPSDEGLSIELQSTTPGEAICLALRAWEAMHAAPQVVP